MKNLLIINDTDLNIIGASAKELLNTDVAESSRIQTLLWIHEDQCTPLSYRIYHKQETQIRKKTF